MAKSRMEDAYEEMIDALKGFPLFTMTQAKRLIGCFGNYASGDWSNQALHTIAKNAYRLREERIRHRKRREIVYARTKAEQRRWCPADKAMIVAALNRTEDRVVRRRWRREQRPVQRANILRGCHPGPDLSRLLRRHLATAGEDFEAPIIVRQFQTSRWLVAMNVLAADTCANACCPFAS